MQKIEKFWDDCKQEAMSLEKQVNDKGIYLKDKFCSCMGRTVTVTGFTKERVFDFDRRKKEGDYELSCFVDNTTYTVTVRSLLEWIRVTPENEISLLEQCNTSELAWCREIKVPTKQYSELYLLFL